MRFERAKPLVIPAFLIGTALLLAGCEKSPSVEGPETASVASVDGRTPWPGFDDSSLPPHFGYGRPATVAEVATLAVGVSPDGSGLPAGRGTVATGSAVYAAQCAGCHGPRGEGVPQLGDRLVGTEPIDSTGFNRTIGNYWPYATTLFDYIRRTMPFDRPGSLADDEVYSLAAFLLHLNEIVPADAVLDAVTLPLVVMPARDRFVIDDRLETSAIR